jgi:hypothetical protein
MFSCSLDFLYGGLRISKLLVKIFKYLVIKTIDLDPPPDPH